MLVFDVCDGYEFVVAGIGLLWALRREIDVVIVEMIYQNAGSNDVAAGDIRLKFDQVADPEEVSIVGVGGKFGVDRVVVLAVESVVEPELSLLNRAGKREPRQELIELPSSFVLKRGNEIGRDEAKVVIASSGIQKEQASRAFAEFCGLARGFHLDRTKSVRADAGQQLAVGGLCDVETIEHGDGLIGFRTGDVRLSAQVLHHAGDEVEDVAIVAGSGIRNVDDIEAAERLLGSDLGGVDGGRRFLYVDYFADFLLAGESYVDSGGLSSLWWSYFDLGMNQNVEAFFFDAKLVRSGSDPGKTAAS